MTEVIQIVLSIFGLIGIGYGCSRLGYVGASVGDALSEFVQKIAVPVLLARTMMNAEFAGLSPWRFWLAYFGGVAVVWILAHLMIRRMFGRDARVGAVAGLSTGFANSVLIGIPLISSAYGEDGIVYLLMLVAVHLPVMMAATMVVLEWGSVAEGRLGVGPVITPALARDFGVRLVANPIIIAIVIGLVVRLVGLKPTGALELVVDKIAGVAGPVALLSVGMGLSKFGMARQLRPALGIAFLKLVAMPAFVLAFALAIGLPPVAIGVAVLTAACPTGVTAFIIAGQFGTGQALASNAVAISTAAGVVTVGLWLAVMQALLG